MIKYLFLLTFLVPLYSATQQECGLESRPAHSLKQLKDYLKPRLHPDSVPLEQLAPAIKRASDKYGVPQRLIASVILVESRGIPTAMNKKSLDYGILQINPIHKLDEKCLRNWECNLEYGTSILSKVRRVCEYNVGRRGVKTKLKACQRYEAKVRGV